MGSKSSKSESGMDRGCKIFKNIYSTCLLIFCTVMVLTAIFTGQTTLAAIHPALAFVVLALALIWLAMVEGSQASLVGLPPVEMELYESSHPRTHFTMSKINTGDTLDRYLMGRQFLVLALVFIENLCGDPSKGAEVLNMPQAVLNIFLGSGLALFFMTTMISKVSAQVNASRCMLDYANNYFCTFTLYASLALEISGILHVC